MRAFALLALLFSLVFSLGPLCGPRPWSSPHEPVGHGLFASPQAQPLALSPDGSRLYVAATTSGLVSVIDTATLSVPVQQLRVGLDPVGIAVRPDGSEVWVTNHISDSVSVIDSDPASPTYHELIATLQDLDANGATRFDEPVGVAFASDAKAYVALSSTNEIAVVDIGAGSYTVRPARLAISGQDPRAIAVRGGRLYVTAFESGNQTEISACVNGNAPPDCTIGESDLLGFAVSPNLPGLDKNILVDPQVPDRDLFVFDASDESTFDVVSGVGTLLYGLAVDSTGLVFVSQTEARNDVNGLQGGALIDLDNRLFLNQLGVVDCGGASCGSPSRIELEPLPPGQPLPTDALATPYGIAVSDDDQVLVVTAAASSRLATLDVSTGAVRDRIAVGAIPRGVVLQSSAATGAPETAYVLDTLDDTVTVVDVSNPDALAIVATVAIGNDTTPEAVRLGRIAFNSAEASSTKTFSCASCHPDAHTDQLMWRIGGACDPSLDPACGGDEPRSTMPIRGLENTLPLHWDGTLGDPFGGTNGAFGTSGAGGTDCVLGDADLDHDCFLDLVNASLSGVMCDPNGSCPPGGNELSALERDDMAHFLASVFYPPARSRRMDDGVSTGARDGFSDFFVDQGGLANIVDITTCADADNGCHALPLGVSTNSNTVGGFEAPTMRGMTDRFLLFSLGHTSTQEILLANTSWNPATEPIDEFRAFDAGFPSPTAGFSDAYNVLAGDIFQMFEEAGTGTSGATGRQVTLSVATTTGGAELETYPLLDALVAADEKGVVDLFGDGVHLDTPVNVSYDAAVDLFRIGPTDMDRATLESSAEGGDLRATFTAYLPEGAGVGTFQPLLATVGIAGPTGSPALPILPTENPMTLVGEAVAFGATILVDGELASGSVTCSGGSFGPFCSTGVVVVTLAVVPANGLHLLQVQNPGGRISNELPICVGGAGFCD